MMKGFESPSTVMASVL